MKNFIEGVRQLEETLKARKVFVNRSKLLSLYRYWVSNDTKFDDFVCFVESEIN